MNTAPAPRLILGAMNFGKRTPRAEAYGILDRAYERGVREIDTANAYVDGESERIVGAWASAALRSGKIDLSIATKAGWWSRGGVPEGLSAARVVEACDESLARLGVDAVDVFYLHAPDHGTPIEATLEGVAKLFSAGKIRELAFSNYASWEALELLLACDRAGVPRPRRAQVLYNLLIRQLDLEYTRFASRHGVASVAYNALAGGLLTGRHTPDARPERGSRFDKNRMYQGRYWSARFFEEAAAYAAIAAERGMTLLELAYRFLATSPRIDSILLGPATRAQLDAALDACAAPLDDETMGAIDAQHGRYLGTDASYAR
jgi:aryl-alcohol dehydrogenase-like predicted oxidoreductase